MFFLFLIFVFVCVKPQQIFAAPTVSIVDFPENIIAGEVFNVTFSVTDTTANNYHYKVVGDGNNEVLTQPNTGCASNYENCENINIATDSANIATASAKLNLVSGIYKIKIRIAQSDKHPSTSNSDIVSISSILPSPTPTVEPTSTPHPTPTPTKTLTPTPTPTPTSSQIPTKIPTISPASPIPTTETTPISEPSETSESAVLGIETTINSFEVSDNSKTKNNKIGIIFIIIGGLLLLSPLLVTKLHQLKIKNK